ncbi:MAG: hypothetical protein V4659_10215 [Pseudomonadota bacterium]
MYSESDLENAVGAGALTPEAAQAFRAHVATGRATPAVDEESFRLLTGFNDIFVSIAIVLTLVAVGWIGGSLGGESAIGGVLGSIAVAAASWGLAEYFTRQRRMALPSIVLLLTFVGGVASTLTSALIANAEPIGESLKAQTSNEYAIIAIAGVVGAIVAGLTAASAWLHWRRFMVPITVAAGAVAVVGVVLSLIFGFIPAARDFVMPIVLLAGLGMFAFAMRWDVSDLERRTRRSDVAFWLHLAAAPMIAHALFNLLGVFEGSDITALKAVAVLALYVAFAFVALAIDRRALLVSSLVYVLYALYALFTQAGAVELGGALTALVIGSALLTLSAFWQPMRLRVVGLLGNLAGRLPPVAIGPSPRPA